MMKTRKQLVWISILLLIVLSSASLGALDGVDSITADGTSGQDPINLTSITVGTYTVSANDLQTGATAGASAVDNLNLYSYTTLVNPLDTLMFGGSLWSNTNGDEPDFFVFEGGGNDSGTISAIFSDDSVGQSVNFTSGVWGNSTGYKSGANQLNYGFAFAITDLKDTNGTNLTNSSVIKGIRVASGGIDPTCICAVVVGSQPNSPPSITSTAVTTAYVGKLYSYDVNATGNPAPTYSLSVYPAGMTIDVNTGLVEWTASSAGDVNVTVVAANGEEPNATQSYTITVSEPPPAGITPITSITADGESGPDPIMLQSITVGSFTVDVNNLQNGTGSGTYTGSGDPSYPVANADNMNINSFASQYNPHLIINFGGGLFTDDNGNNFDFFIFENGGTDSGTIQAIFPDDSLGDTISFSSSSWGDTGYTSSVGDQAIKGLAFEIRDLLDANGVNLTNSSVIKGIRINSSGLDPSCVCAVVPITLEAPTITSSPVTSVIAEQLYTYDVDANGNPAPTYSLSVSPSGMTIYSSTGIIEWTPEVNQIGIHQVRVLAENSEGNDLQVFDINVSGLAAEIVSDAVLSAYVGELYTYDVDANGVPAPTYSLSIAPAGMDINSATGVIQWTPLAQQLGINPVQVVAQNSEGNDVQVFDINVTETPLCPEGIVHYWKLDETTGSPYMDSIGGSDACCVSCPAAITGFLEGALDFNGVSDYLSTPNIINPSSAITVMAWIKPYDLGQSGPDECIISKENVFELTVEENGDRVSWVILDGQGSYDEYEPSAAENTISEGAWTHVAATFDGSKQAIYINGDFIGEDNAAFSTLGNPNNPYLIGYSGIWEDRYFDGGIDEVAVYNEALSATDINQIYEDGLAGQTYCKQRPDFVTLELVSLDGGVGISGDLQTGFDLLLNGQDELYSLNAGENTQMNKSILADGEDPIYFGFYLSEPNATLVTYFENKHAGMPYEDELVAIANGESPIFYLKVENVNDVEVFSLIDGFLLDTQVLTPVETYLRINGDYPETTYVYTGWMEDEFGVINVIDVTMSVCHDTDGDTICDSQECALANLDGEGDIDFIDFGILANNWLLDVPLQGDMDGNGEVEFVDLLQITERWLGQCQ